MFQYMQTLQHTGFTRQKLKIQYVFYSKLKCYMEEVSISCYPGMLIFLEQIEVILSEGMVTVPLVNHLLLCQGSQSLKILEPPIYVQRRSVPLMGKLVAEARWTPLVY